jgi:hypothetical protein
MRRMRRSSGASTNAQTKNWKGAGVRMRKISVAQTYPVRARFHRNGRARSGSTKGSWDAHTSTRGWPNAYTTAPAAECGTAGEWLRARSEVHRVARRPTYSGCGVNRLSRATSRLYAGERPVRPQLVSAIGVHVRTRAVMYSVADDGRGRSARPHLQSRRHRAGARDPAS